ncbi:MAG: DUF3987 domain-containing protein [Bacteriovoracaceae bacterium]|nr:DUF3987 domain-containing protein [Bacteriovoracaceae bacterium]
MSDIDLLGRIASHTQAKRTKNGFIGHCPCHHDSNPSLSITATNNKTNPLIYCHAGCSQEDLISYFRRHSLWLSKETSSVSFDSTNNRDIKKKDTLMISKIIKECNQLSQPNPATLYIKNRGLLPVENPSLLYHPKLIYNECGKTATHPALVAKITDLKGTTLGIQRIYLTNNGDKALLSNPKKVLGDLKGNAIMLDAPNDVLHIAEGLETALAVREALKESTWSVVNANNILTVNLPANIKELHIWADKDKSKTGEIKALEAAKTINNSGVIVYVHVPPLEVCESSKGVDWLDVLNQPNGKALILEGRNNDPVYPWESPTLITKVSKKAPPLPPNIIPPTVRDFVIDVSERLQVPSEFVAIPLIVCSSILIGNKLAIYPKKFDSWSVTPNLWGAIIAKPSTKKTPAQKSIISLLNKLSTQERQRVQQHNEKNKVKIISIKEQIEGIKSKLKARKNIDENENELTLLIAELEKTETSEKRYYINDATVEMLTELLKVNSNGLLVFRDELMGFLKSLDKPNRCTDRAFFLESWDGSLPFQTGRISRGEVYIESLCLSILGGIQPSKLKPYINDAVNGLLGDDGFIQRFQLIVYPEIDHKYEYVDRKPNTKAKEEVQKFLKGLEELNLDHFDIDGNGQHYVKFSENAQKVLSKWLIDHETRLRSGKIECHALELHLAKYASLMPSLALIFHLMDYVAQKTRDTSVSQEATAKAILWCQFLEGHADKIYSLAVTQETNSAVAIAQKIKSNEIANGTSAREILRHGWSKLKRPKDIHDGLIILELNNWIMLEVDKPVTGRPSSPTIKINPILFKNNEYFKTL